MGWEECDLVGVPLLASGGANSANRTLGKEVQLSSLLRELWVPLQLELGRNLKCQRFLLLGRYCDPFWELKQSPGGRAGAVVM